MKNFTSIQVSQLVYSFALHATTETAKDILEPMEVGNKDAEKKKLEFDLSIAFIVKASDVVCGRIKWDNNLRKAIMDGVCDLYFADLEKFRQEGHTKNSVNVGFFIRNKDEIALFCAQLPQNAKVDINNFHGHGGKTSLYTLASLFFNKRFLEYQELLKSDTIKGVVNKQPGFLPQMPHKVYEHWSGKAGEESSTMEPIMFVTVLDTHLCSFGLALAKQISEITVNNRQQ
ncbi:MAG: hypothetical protein KKC11_00445 [Candidatus Omnitrophica bacterium]|nr:hypothetical protein [Candidatus Omnitrophota bacterium]MBU0878633.1 hypothetical protein [Candidatus Omnitrophota bacterium]MBU0897443.1 hypothetical protein [Candidatus Omnitrophota bacterium]MBU1366784.1 hypothetical protein [Candidatus Omnitrophota bacterium]MBU1810281.1 hypothetical protein [Candidatus Omnitrophota bacterium]